MTTKLRLIFDVVYTLHDTDLEELKDNLRSIAHNAYEEGLVTQSTRAEAEDCIIEVQEFN